MLFRGPLVVLVVIFKDSQPSRDTRVTIRGVSFRVLISSNRQGLDPEDPRLFFVRGPRQAVTDR